MPQQITLAKDWNHVPAGTVLAILGAGENPRPGAVDARRAAQLIADQLATEGDTAPAAIKRMRRPAKGATADV